MVIRGAWVGDKLLHRSYCYIRQKELLPVVLLSEVVATFLSFNCISKQKYVEMQNQMTGIEDTL